MSATTEPENSAALHPAQANVADYAGRSNLALAFLSLSQDKRADMNVFYTFCRLVDDIADSATLPPEEKTALLAAWREALRRPMAEQPDAERKMTGQLHTLIAKYHLPVEHFTEIIAGVEMDIFNRHYATFEQLRAYCYRVASVVGLVSIEIFGYRGRKLPAIRGRSGLGSPINEHYPRCGRGPRQWRTHLPAARRPGAFRLSTGRLAGAGVRQTFSRLDEF